MVFRHIFKISWMDEKGNGEVLCQMNKEERRIKKELENCNMKYQKEGKQKDDELLG